MILDSTLRSIEIVLAGAITTNQLKVTAAWVDMDATTTTPGSTLSTSNNTTAVTAVAAPAASTQRKVSSLSIYNADTASATVAVRYNDNATIYPIVTISVPSGYTLFWTDVEGWKVISGAGSLQMGVVGPAGLDGLLTSVNEQTGTTYTLVLADATKAVRVTNGSAITVTVPTNASVALPVRCVIPVFQGGAGLVTLAAAVGVTFESPFGLATTAIGDFRILFQRAANIWVVC